MVSHPFVAAPELAAPVVAFAHAARAPCKRVGRIEFVAELPKTLSGTIGLVDPRRMQAGRRRSGARAGHEHFEDDSPDFSATAGHNRDRP